MTIKQIAAVLTTILLTLGTIALVGEMIISPSLAYYGLASNGFVTYTTYLTAAIVFYIGFRGMLMEDDMLVYGCRALIFTSFTIMGYLSWPAILGWFMSSVGIFPVHMGVVVSMAVAVVYIAFFDKVRKANLRTEG